jgi:hypothetical protein
MGMIDRFRSIFIPPAHPYVDNYLPFVSFNGNTYPLGGLTQTLQGNVEPIASDFAGLVQGAYQRNGIVFACMLARRSLFSEARFMFRQRRSGTPGELFSLPSLDILTTPWANGTTGDLLSRAIQDVDLAGNAFFLRRGARIIRLRPDWVVIVHGSFNDPDVGMWDPEAELLGYGYQPGGPASGRTPIFYQASEVAHFAPEKDPLAPDRGISWLTPILREIEGDSAMTDHKRAFLANGATVNLVVTGVPSASKEQFKEWVDTFEGKHRGIANAYKSLYLSPTMDAKAVGSDMAQLDFKVVQGAGETRIAAAAGVPAAVVGISEGLQGSSLNAGNFGAAMRRFADMTMRPLWRDVCGSLSTIVPPPPASELWYDDRDVPALKDDVKSAAEVQQLQAQAVHQYVVAGFDPASVVDAVKSGDLSRLTHTGLYSVQLQPPMPEGQPEPEAPEPEPEPEDAAPAREQLLLLARTAEAHERRADAAERMAEREPPAPVVNVTTPEVTVHPADVNVTIERGAVEAPITIEPAVVNVTTPEVRNEITVEPSPVEITVEPSPVEVRNEVTVEPTPLEVHNEVNVEPTPVTITNEIPEPRTVTKRVIRDAKNQITEIVEEPTDG